MTKETSEPSEIPRIRIIAIKDLPIIKEGDESLGLSVAEPSSREPPLTTTTSS